MKELRIYALLIILTCMLVGAVIADQTPVPVSPAPTATTPPASATVPGTPATTVPTAASKDAATSVSPEDPVMMLTGITDNVMRALQSRKDRSDLSGVYSLVDNYILPYADFNEMSLWVAGRKAWNKASQETRDQFMDAFKVLVVRTYATALNSYTNEKVVFSKQRPDLSKDRIQVSSTIVRQGKDNIRVDYRLIKHDNKWYVYDIIIEGVSILQGFQAQFSNEIKQKGLQAVTSQIQAHNREKNV